MLKVLFFGDLVGKIARKALAAKLPELIKELKPDFVIANGENIAHGKGITKKTCQEVFDAGIDLLTLGNHIADKKDFVELLDDPESRIIRPANYPEGVPGKGIKILEKNKKHLAIINLLGRPFMREIPDDPFRVFDVLTQHLPVNTPIFVDFHGEVTSEKKAFGYYVDGRASVVAGTHTHVQTADERILPKGTGYITDVGMVGAKESVIGVVVEGSLKTHLTQMPVTFEVPEMGVVETNFIVAEIDPNTTRCSSISRGSFDFLVKDEAK